MSKRINDVILPNVAIEDNTKLEALRQICFTEKDLRAGWFGPGIPKTDLVEFQGLAQWATEHWFMYQGFLDEIKDKKSTKKILDIGCGIGHSTINIGEIFPHFEITAVDNDEEAIEFAKQYNKRKNITYISEDFFKFKSAHKYDYIFALEVFEHLPPMLHDLFMDKCLSLLAKDGRLFFTTPNEPDQKDSAYGHIGFLNRKRAQRFIRRYSQNLVSESFINSKKLVSGIPMEFVMDQPMASFDLDTERKSHFRLVMSNNDKETLSNSFMVRYQFLSLFSSLILTIKRFPNKVRAVLGPMYSRVYNLLKH